MIQLHPKSIMVFLAELNFTEYDHMYRKDKTKEEVETILQIWPLFQSYCF